MVGSVGIVGSGLAGATVATRLRAEGYDGRILLFGDEPHHAYDRPSLSKAALLDRIAAPIGLFAADWLADSRIDLRAEGGIDRLDRAGGALIDGTGRAHAVDRIVLATGIRARRLRVPGAELTGVMTLRTFADMESLRGVLVPGARLVVIGGGLVGCEVAGTATKLGARVTVVEAASELLARVLGPRIGAVCRVRLEAMGVAVRLGATVAAIEGEGSVAAVRTGDGDRIAADLVLVSIGGEPADALAAEAGIPCRNGVTVDAVGRSSDAAIFAAGDVANWPLADGGSRSLETYLNAQGQAAAVARAILGHDAPAPQIAKGWTEIAGQRIQMVGDIAGPGTTELRQRSGEAALMLFRTDPQGVLRAAIAVDAPGDFAAAMRLVERGFRPRGGELADPGIGLRDLVKKQQQMGAVG
jgi:NAD(P)H-nitrite reductase large subunit